MLAEWDKARAEKLQAIEQQRREQIKELRAEIRKTRGEMKELGLLQPHCRRQLPIQRDVVSTGDSAEVAPRQ